MYPDGIKKRDFANFHLHRSGYQHYSLVTSEEIEKMRMDERLKVVRGLEENTMKSACRRVTSDLLQPNAVIGKHSKL